MVLKRSWTIGLLPTSSIWRPPGWTGKPARLINPYRTEKGMDASYPLVFDCKGWTLVVQRNQSAKW